MNAPPASGSPESPGIFATTHWSVILEARNEGTPEAKAALENLCSTYWPAIHAYLRRLGRTPEAASDLTQSFFAHVLEKSVFHRADRDKGRFRAFLLTVLRRFLADQHDREQSAKRGGGQRPISLDALAQEENFELEASRQLTPEQEFDRRWALATMARAFQVLRSEAEGAGNGDVFAAVQDHLADGDPGRTLEAIAANLGTTEAALKMRLHRWRTRYRELLRQEVAQTVPNLAEVDAELQHLFAALTA